jgi:hypothetical protein
MNNNEMIFEVYESDAWSTLTVIDGLGQTFALDVQRWHTELLHDDIVVLGSVVDVRRTGNVFTFVDGDKSRVNVVALRWYDTTPTVDEVEPPLVVRCHICDDTKSECRCYEDDGVCEDCKHGKHGMITADSRCVCCGEGVSFYDIVETSAPRAYDYDDTKEIGSEFGSRTVAIPHTGGKFQQDRYMSGMHTVKHLGKCYKPADWQASGDKTWSL